MAFNYSTISILLNYGEPKMLKHMLFISLLLVSILPTHSYAAISCGDCEVLYGINGGKNNDGAIYTLEDSSASIYKDGLLNSNALAFDAVDQRLYYVSNGRNIAEYNIEPNSHYLAYVDMISSEHIIVGQLNRGFYRLAFDSNNLLHASAGNLLYTLDKETAEANRLGAISGIPKKQSRQRGDIAFAHDGTLYMVTKTSLFTIDIINMQAHEVGRHDIHLVSGMDFNSAGQLMVSSIVDRNPNQAVSNLYFVDTSDASAELKATVPARINDLTYACHPGAIFTDIYTNTTSIPADGISTSTIYAQVKNPDGSDYPYEVTEMYLYVEMGEGTLGPVNYVGNGLYSAQLTSSTNPGTTVVGGFMNDEPIWDEAKVTFEPLELLANIYLEGNSSLPADGTSSTYVYAQIIDENNNHFNGPVDSFTFSLQNGITHLGPVEYLGNGLYAALITAGMTTGYEIISGELNGSASHTTVMLELTAAANCDDKLNISGRNFSVEGESTISITSSQNAAWPQRWYVNNQMLNAGQFWSTTGPASFNIKVEHERTVKEAYRVKENYTVCWWIFCWNKSKWVTKYRDVKTWKESAYRVERTAENSAIVRTEDGADSDYNDLILNISVDKNEECSAPPIEVL